MTKVTTQLALHCPAPQDPSGTYMATAGADSQLKVWDVRMLRPMHAYFAHSPITSLDISQRGIMAAGYGRKIQVGCGAIGARYGCAAHCTTRIANERVVAARGLAIGHRSSAMSGEAPLSKHWARGASVRYGVISQSSNAAAAEAYNACVEVRTVRCSMQTKH